MTRHNLPELLALEYLGWDSLCESRGGQFYGKLMTQDAVMILVNGMVPDRATATLASDPEPFVA